MSKSGCGLVQVFPQLSILGANVGAGLEFTVCILLGSFMSSEHDYLVCICTTEGSNKGQQRGFLKATLWRLVLPGSTDEMTRQCDRRELGTEALGGESGNQVPAAFIPPTTCAPEQSTVRPSFTLKWQNWVRHALRFLLAWTLYFSSLWNALWIFMNSEKTLMQIPSIACCL